MRRDGQQHECRGAGLRDGGPLDCERSHVDRSRAAARYRPEAVAVDEDYQFVEVEENRWISARKGLLLRDASECDNRPRKNRGIHCELPGFEVNGK
jgi:hypothetical protein